MASLLPQSAGQDPEEARRVPEAEQAVGEAMRSSRPTSEAMVLQISKLRISAMAGMRNSHGLLEEGEALPPCCGSRLNMDLKTS
jgi:hypothetical protein